MLNRKPEFIDPEENKFTYYYNRNKNRKQLEEKECCPSRRKFLVFETTKGKVGLVLVYLILLAYIYISSSRYTKTNIAKYNDIKIKISNYYIDTEKKVYLNIFFESKKEEDLLHIDSIYVKLKKNKLTLEKEIAINQDIKISPTYSASYEFSFKEKPSEISLTLFLRNDDKIIPIEMKNKF
ncbi:MAG TPA: hypothetical protein PKW55_03405 [Spirochaetota bacterium]|nr:hypothetical protein [Spirochaetota bacterium]HOM38118.1 hypothetical protein [Spirochaetota bacterium]HPQ48920.1 hypothetical protein [Spirochaetota bacterium]